MLSAQTTNTMKKALRLFTTLLLLVSIIGVCGTVSSCKSQDNMYTTKKKTSKTIKSNYKVRGNNQRNSSTYHSY